jgi:hypothetical protein
MTYMYTSTNVFSISIKARPAFKPYKSARNEAKLDTPTKDSNTTAFNGTVTSQMASGLSTISTLSATTTGNAQIFSGRPTSTMPTDAATTKGTIQTSSSASTVTTGATNKGNTKTSLGASTRTIRATTKGTIQTSSSASTVTIGATNKGTTKTSLGASTRTIRATTKGTMSTMPTKAAITSVPTAPGLDPAIFRQLKERELAASDKEILLDLLKVFIRVADAHNWTYYMEGGTLLGSIRHWGFIPWDDDVDVTINKTDVQELKRVFKALEPNYTLFERSYDRTILKLFSNKSYRCVWKKSCNYKWPCIDVFLFTEDKHRLWSVGWFGKYKHLKSNIFPLHFRPFEGLMVKAPKCGLAWLKTVYGNSDTCLSETYTHYNDIGRKLLTVSCVLLKDIYPFVSRRWVDGRVEETLKIGNKTLGVKFVK